MDTVMDIVIAFWLPGIVLMSFIMFMVTVLALLVHGQA